MATWDETRNYLSGKYILAVDEPKWLGLTWKFKDAKGEEDVLQRQRVELVQAFGQPQLLILSDIVPAAGVPESMALAALRHNMTLGIGAIAVTQDTYVIRTILPLEDLIWDQLDRALEYTAHEAARLREAGAEPEPPRET